jgi:uncharacterized phage infection (PIP) family protein YhgE
MNVHASENQHVQQAWMNGKPKNTEARTAAQEGAALAKESAAAGEAAEGQKGVIRLLQAGHFNGVADVRLRINFHDQLQQAAAQNATKAFEEAVPGLLDDLAGKLGRIGEEYDLSAQEKELAESLATEVQLLLDEAKTAQSPLSSTLASINAKFSSFLESLEGALAALPSPGEEDSGLEEEVAELLDESDTSSPDDQTLDQIASALNEDGSGELEEGAGQPAEEPSTLKTAVQNLADWFSQSLAELQSNATAAQQLPPLSAPRGNGAAYSKFLEIYRNLNSVIETGTNPAGSLAAGIDAEA